MAARVSVDGEELGTTPCTVRVPVCARKAEHGPEEGGSPVSSPLEVRARTTTEVTARP